MIEPPSHRDLNDNVMNTVFADADNKIMNEMNIRLTRIEGNTTILDEMIAYMSQDKKKWIIK